MKPDDGYIAYIENPKSGAGSNCKVLCQQFKDYLIENGFDVRSKLSSSLSNAYKLASDAAVDYDCAMVVVVGGDGIVREVAAGLEGSDKKLLIVPAGTENLLASELGFDEKLRTIIKTFEAEYVKIMDLGCANGKCFTSIAGFGFDGQVVKGVNDKRNGHINHFDYLWPIWRTFWNYRFENIKVEIDGEEIFDGKGLIFVGNISRYAMGIKILSQADYSDGLLDVCIYKCSGHIHMLKHTAMTVLKRHARCDDVIYKQGKEIVITSKSSNVCSEIDGDPGPDLPVKIEVIPNAVNMLVPKGAKPVGVRTRIMRGLA